MIDAMGNTVQKVSKKMIFSVASLIAGLVVVFTTIGINDNGYRTVVQWPNGTTFVKFSPGVYFSLFGSTEVYTDVVTHELNGEGIKVRYQDGGTGSVDGVVRVALPSDEMSMLELHRAVRSVEGFRNKLLLPEVKQSLNLTAGLMTSEEAYAVRRNDYATWAEDQLANGRYVTELVERTVTTTEGNTQTKKVPAIRTNKDNLPMHQNSAFSDYSLRVTGFQITDWDFEPKTLKQISDKREAEMAIITAKANANKAVWQQKQIKADGEKEVERVRYEQLRLKEKETIIADRKKQVAVIDAERIKEVNIQQEQAALIDVRTAKQEGIATKTRADAEAYAKKAVIMADGALDKKLAAYKEVQAAWAKAYSNRKVPSMVMGASAGDINSDTSQFQSMLNALIAKDLMVDAKVSK